MYREGGLYYYYLRKASPAKRMVPKVSKNAQWVQESNAATSKTATSPQPAKEEIKPSNDSNFWDLPAGEGEDDYGGDECWYPWTTVKHGKTRKVTYHPFGRQGYRL